MITAMQDRKQLGWDIPTYQKLAECLSQNCFPDKHGNFVKIQNQKRKKLKNLRHQIMSHPIQSQSPIHLELVRRLTMQIEKNERRPRL